MEDHSIYDDRGHLRYLEKSYFDKGKDQVREKENSRRILRRPFSCIHRRPVDFDYKKSSPVYILRGFLNSKRSTSRQEKSKFGNKQYLQEKLDENCNVFMNGYEVDKKDLQDILWEKSYLLKSSINGLKEENNNLRAKVWNFEKENRKMQKQIDSWNLEKYPLLEGKKTPYLDSSTMEKVFQDQDYSVVTMKIELDRLTDLLAQKEGKIQKNNEILSNFSDHEELVNGRIAL